MFRVFVLLGLVGTVPVIRAQDTTNSSAATLGQGQCFVFDCCEDDCCGPGTEWDDDGSTGCLPNQRSLGWRGSFSNSDGYRPGCVKERVCCEENCCATGTTYDATDGHCVPSAGLPLNPVVGTNGGGGDGNSESSNGPSQGPSTTPTAAPTMETSSPVLAVSTTPAPVAPVAPPLPPTPGYPVCAVCPEDGFMGNPDQIIDTINDVPFTCGDAFVAGKFGFVQPEACQTFLEVVDTVCICAIPDELPTNVASRSSSLGKASYPDCSICDEGERLTSPDMTVDIPPLGAVSCRFFNEIGRKGLLEPDFCETLQGILKADCHCSAPDS